MADVQAACDVLASVHDEAGGRTDSSRSRSRRTSRATPSGTIESARKYWHAVDRPNVMIKIPGTAEGVDAIEQAI